MIAGTICLIYGLIFGGVLIIRLNSLAAGLEKELPKHGMYKPDLVTIKVFIVLFALIAIAFGVGMCYLFWVDSR